MAATATTLSSATSWRRSTRRRRPTRPVHGRGLRVPGLGASEINGRDAVVQLRKGVFGKFEQVKFETVHQAVNGDVAIAEQIHGLGLPGGKLAPIMNMAIYEIRDGKIAAWRDTPTPPTAPPSCRADHPHIRSASATSPRSQRSDRQFGPHGPQLTGLPREARTTEGG